MLPKIHRLKKDQEFRKIYHFGERIKSDFFILKHLQNKFSHSRFGFVIPAKVMKKAVARNSLKRRLTEIIRLNLEKIKTSYDIVILVHSFLEPEEKNLKEKIIKLLKKANLYIND